MAAGVVGFGGAAVTGFRLPWSVLVAVLAGTFGWILGSLLAQPLVAWLRGRRYGPGGRPAYRLRELPPTETTAGGKARSLAALIQGGHRVPDGLVLLPSAFVDDRLTAEVEQWLQRELKAFPEGQLFAVRSSALAEDSASASFAGAYESVLNVPVAHLAEATAQVRQSRKAERVRAYAAAAEAAGTGEVAVAIQAMVPAELAGALFTVHPITRDLNTMLGNVVTGLGEALVSGADTGAEFTLTRPDASFTGPNVLRPQARRLHAVAHQVEGTFGGVPQDIEWAIVEGTLWILQSRPITTLNASNPRTAERNDSVSGNCLWAATNLSEANPVPQTPLTISYMAYLQANGGPSMAVRGRQMAGYIGGRPYANLSVQITARRGRSRAEPRVAYRKLAGWWGQLPEQVPVTLIPVTQADWQQSGLPLLGTLVKMSRYRHRLDGYLRDNAGHCADLSARIAAAATPEQLAALWRTSLLDQGLFAFWMTIATGSEGPAHLEAELRAELGAADTAALMSNLSGLAGQLESLGPSVGLQEVLAGRLSREDYSARFGHRGVNEIELAWPRPAEDPDWLDAALRAASAGSDLATLRAKQQAVFTETLTRLGKAHPRRAAKIQRRLRKAAKQAAGREAARSESVRTTWVMRRFALRAGELLGIGEQVFFLTVPELLAALDGNRDALDLLDLRERTHQRYLALPPLPGVIYGAFDPFAWAADPHRRTDYWVAGVATPSESDHDDPTLIQGCAGAVGQVEGLVRRLDDFGQADQLQPGEILVTHLTNIGWTPLFPRAAAVVTDLGAPLSHAAIVARELGIPAVVGCGDATARLRTGDRVVVDGARGEVRILSSAASPRSRTSTPRSAPSSTAGTTAPTPRVHQDTHETPRCE
ncbi:MAG TPA: PEP/pyruvate-binding domain-containing protein [Arthrobacter sp.]|nr:PEP/pyruvate-binding domain-containing protein [Arthrobacter sp.]